MDVSAGWPGGFAGVWPLRSPGRFECRTDMGGAMPRGHPDADAVIEFVAFDSRRLRITHHLQARLLRMMGDLDYVTLPTLVRALDSITGGGDVFIDLAALQVIDVAALRALVDVAARLPGEHAVILGGAPPQVYRLLEATGWRETPRLRLETPAAVPDCSEQTSTSSRPPSSA